MSKFLVKFKTNQLKHVADSGSMAEEVISTIRTAQAFATQVKLAVLFDKDVAAGSILGYKQGVTLGIGLGIMCKWLLTRQGRPHVVSPVAYSLSFPLSLSSIGLLSSASVL
jgi:hypothetical protein